MKSIHLERSAKLEILKAIVQLENQLFEERDAVDLFDFILDLRALPSNDPRYIDAKGDFTQHYLNNNDWELEYILLDRFDFLDSDKNFFKLLNVIISPETNKSEEKIKFIYHTLNPILNKFQLEYRVFSISVDGLSIFEVSVFDVENRFKDVVDNKIPFTFKRENHKYNECFILNPTYWDDFGKKNSFHLHYYNGSETQIIGSLKIISKDNSSTTKEIVSDFTNLNEKYCSLGQSIDFYNVLKNIFNNKYISVLKALNDAAFFTQIYEEFEDVADFKNSLIRFDEQEQLLRQARYRIDNYDLSNLYSFKYSFKPDYFNKDDVALEIKFDFNSISLIPNRVYALIGENGVGKTQLVSKLPIDIAQSRNELFKPKTPLFSKIIAVSYSVFDSFTIPESSSKMNYVYCGLRETLSETALSKDNLRIRFFQSMEKIQKSKRFESWCEINKSFFSEEIVGKWSQLDSKTFQYKLDINEFSKSLKNFSSGQSIFIYVLTEILANIRYDSLIIFDEPETHLHPNAISQLINSIHVLVQKFQSYCIIATHSPIIVQGILSKNVFIMRNESKVITARHPSIETFGENLTKITDEIFGSREIPSHFKEELKKLVSSGLTYEQILNLIQSDSVPLSLNLTVLLKSMVVKNHD